MEKDGKVTDVKCRICTKYPESVGHIISGCTMLAGKQYTEWHNNMLRVIYHYLLYLFKFTEGIHPWYEQRHTQNIRENDECLIYWDYPIPTDTTVKNNKVDICIILKKKDEIWMVEGSCPCEENAHAKINIKRNTYIELGIDLKRVYNKATCRTVELVIGATGMVEPSVGKSLANMLGDEKLANNLIQQCQKVVILGTNRICRQVLYGT